MQIIHPTWVIQLHNLLMRLLLIIYPLWLRTRKNIKFSVWISAVFAIWPAVLQNPPSNSAAAAHSPMLSRLYQCFKEERGFWTLNCIPCVSSTHEKINHMICLTAWLDNSCWISHLQVKCQLQCTCQQPLLGDHEIWPGPTANFRIAGY